ncbi:Proton/glutamate symporter @ Sodium/glutamate symporter [hydrothermal vent metagenome]|uniref:Proton/glutamate symporter @ Sodium/glutamate symporter n=1 Tax=hydrothermal vent metagenome TaxID=652676 RepID=A0A3B1CTB6_9ZZZZ
MTVNTSDNNDKKSYLTYWILGSIIVAIACALAFPHFSMSLKVGGEIFLRLLKMMVVPLVVTSVMVGILGMGDIRKLGRPGGYTILYYLTTTILAVVVGLIVVNIIEPGVGVIDQAALEKVAQSGAAKAGMESATIGAILNNLLLMLFTDNLVTSAAETNLLPLIVFSIIFAAMLTTMGERVTAFTQIITQVNEAFMSFILLLMKVAPLGIFCLVAARFGQAQAEGKFLETLGQLGYYVLTVLAGLSIHAFITIPALLWIFTRRNPFRFMFQMSQALLTAFSTASSSATLPVTLECAITKARVSKRSTDFVLPLGATINMDGTALYEAVAAIFIAQAIGMDLTLMQQVTIAITATLAAIGAAGIPEAGLVTMVIVLNAVGIPVEYIGLILAVDWFLDRFRTAVNVLGDSAGAAIIEKTLDNDVNGSDHISTPKR